MKQIRGLLAASQVTPAHTRYNPTTDTIQVTPDGGTTWNNAPGLDPRNQVAYQLPGRGGSDPKCDAAANMVRQLKLMIAQAERDIAAFQMATAFLGIVGFFLGDVGILADLILTVADGLISIGFGEITLAFTDEQWSIIECILYCDSEPDGTLTADDLSQILDDIHARCLTVVSDVMVLIALMNGFVGLSNAGATGTETGDCTGCSCDLCYTWDFEVADGGWIPLESRGNWVSGQGWEVVSQDTGRYIEVYYTFPSPVSLVHFQANYGENCDYTHEGSGTWLAAVQAGGETNLTGFINDCGASIGISWDGSLDDVLQIAFRMEVNPPSGGTAGTRLINALIRGTWVDEPTGGAPC